MVRKEAVGSKGGIEMILAVTTRKALIILLVMLIGTILFIYADSLKEIISSEKRTKSPRAVYVDIESEPNNTVSSGVKDSQGIRSTSAPKIPLRLVGIYELGFDKIACIEDLTLCKTGEYMVGDDIRGARVIQIFADNVVLLKDGRRIILSLGDYSGWNDRDNWIDVVSADCFVVSKRLLREQVQNLNQLLLEIAPVVHVSDGRIDGFVLSRLKEDGIVNQAGFEEQDIIKGVNGQAIDSIKKPFQIYESLLQLAQTEQEPIITIEVERDGEVHTLSYRILQD
ncbi:hypothetical protein OAA99_01210 [Omnitrophica bacterium]|nr:hypothetical protein [Candidatus Omnitrophota bacterium]